MINFNKKKCKAPAPINVDVSVTSGLQRKKAKEPSLRFSFSERAAMIAFGSDLYGIVGQDPNNPNRIYFTSEDSGSGYKISGMNNESSRKYTTFGCCYPTKKYGDFIGYYNMKYDKVNGAFYIDCNEKKTY